MLRSPQRKVSDLSMAISLLLALLSISGSFALDCWDTGTCEQCNETASKACANPSLAWCDQEPNEGAFYCECMEDVFGDGFTCSTEAAVVSTSFKIGTEWDNFLSWDASLWSRLNFTTTQTLKTEYTAQFIDIMDSDDQPAMWSFSYRITGEGDGKWVSVMALVEDLDAAALLITNWGKYNMTDKMLKRQLTTSDDVTLLGVTLKQDVDLTFSPDEIDGTNCNTGITLPTGYMPVEPRPYSWTTGTTSDPVFVLPVGMDVTNLFFKHDCLSAGCWVVEVEYTIGEDNFNVFYVPRSNNDDTLSYDFDYANDATVFDNTYLAASHPCNLDAYKGDATPGIETAVSACCVPDFVTRYRVMRNFAWDPSPSGCELTGYTGPTFLSINSSCWGSDNAVAGSYVDSNNDPIYNHPNAPIISTENMPPSALTGLFSNWDTAESMEYSNVVQTGVIDPRLGIYRASFFLDEIELRRYMGKLSGTVSVEHTVEFFVGLIDFKPNGLQAGMLNPQAKQIDIYVEKTDFFTVSTHGTNEYTFLRYTNVRLIETFLQDSDNTDDPIAGDNNLGDDRNNPSGELRNDRAIKAQFVQVTFTLGEQYGQKPGYDVIPLDSVRVGRGNFLVENSLLHMCTDYLESGGTDDSRFPSSGDGPLDNGGTTKQNFDTIIGQTCAPQSSMCTNPQSGEGFDALEDSFVAFNIPVGFDFYGNPTEDLSNNIFVSMVVQVENREAMAGNSDLSNVTKTTLTASIPVVDGGVNVFCDSITAKTDLQDVASAKLIIGSAGTIDELSRLRMISGDVVTSSTLDPTDPVLVDTDTIESAMMTLIVHGDSSYFTTTNGMGLELEDLYSLHIMEDDAFFLENGCASAWDCTNGQYESMGAQVYRLLNTPGEELYDSNNNLQVDGYPLNGAFDLRIDRDQGRARLETSAGLDRAKGGINSPCQFGNPGTPELVLGDFRQTCVIRHDVNDEHPISAPFPFNWVTELPDCASTTDCDNVRSGTPLRQGVTPEAFMQTILGNNEEAVSLGSNFARLIRSQEKLNGIYSRAWWINPGYEWTNEQVGGQSLFTVSQKIVLVALIGLNENRAVAARRRFVSVSTRGDRRADATPFTDNSKSASTTLVSSGQTPDKVMARLTGTKPENVKKFEVTLSLTKEDECADADAIRAKGHSALKTAFEAYATDVVDVYVLNAEISRHSSANCRRSLSRKLLEQFSQSTVAMRVMVAFASAEPKFNRDGLESLAGVETVTQDGGSRIEISDDVGPGDNAQLPGWNGNPSSPPADDEGSSSNMGLIGGIVGGVVGAGLIGAIAFFALKRKGGGSGSSTPDTVPTAAQNDLENLKAQLQMDA